MSSEQALARSSGVSIVIPSSITDSIRTPCLCSTGRSISTPSACSSGLCCSRRNDDRMTTANVRSSGNFARETPSCRLTRIRHKRSTTAPVQHRCARWLGPFLLFFVKLAPNAWTSQARLAPTDRGFPGRHGSTSWPSMTVPSRLDPGQRRHVVACRGSSAVQSTCCPAVSRLSSTSASPWGSSRVRTVAAAAVQTTRETLYAIPPSTRYPDPTQTMSFSHAYRFAPVSKSGFVRK